MAFLNQLNHERTPDLNFQAGARDEEAAILAEVCERIVELRELVGPTRAAGFFSKMAAIWSVEPAAFWTVTKLMTGNLDELSRSYTTAGRADAMSKQAMQQQAERSVAVIRRHYPLLAQALIDLKRMTAKIEDVAL